MAPELFAIDIQNFELVGWEVATVIAHILPWFEILIAMAILIPPTRLAGLWAMLCLLSGFTVVLLWSLISGLDIACGCLGAGDGDLPSSIVRNLVLIGITGGMILTQPRLRRA